MFERVDKRFLISKAGGSHTRTHAHKHTQRALMPHITPLRSESHIHVTLLEKMTSQNFPNSHLFIRTHARTCIYDFRGPLL